MATMAQRIADLATRIGQVMKTKASRAGDVFTGPVSAPTLISDDVRIGTTPGGVRYEMNSGGQAAFDGMMVHLAQVGALAEPTLAMLEGFRLRDDPKPVEVQFGKSRGDGDPNSPTFHKRSKQYDRLFRFSTYGSSDFGFSHATYVVVQADYDSLNNNEQPAYLDIRTSNALTNGNGLEINSLAQLAVAGPNQISYGCGVDHKALWRLGPSSAAQAQERLDSGPLPTTTVPGTRTYNGRFTGVDMSGRHKEFLAQEQLSLTLVQILDASVATATIRRGLDWLEVTLTMLQDYDANQVVARVNIAAPADGTAAPKPIIPGFSVGSTSFDAVQPSWYPGAQTNRFSFTAIGKLKAGIVYTLSANWRLP